jgi:hypothetical protein
MLATLFAPASIFAQGWLASRASTKPEAPTNLVPAERLRLMDAIRDLNATAQREYLDQFNDAALKLYLDHLQTTSAPRGRRAIWTRPTETPGIVHRVAP